MDPYQQMIELLGRIRSVPKALDPRSAPDAICALLPSHVLADRLEAVVSLALLIHLEYSSPRQDAAFVNTALIKLSDVFRAR